MSSLYSTTCLNQCCYTCNSVFKSCHYACLNHAVIQAYSVVYSSRLRQNEASTSTSVNESSGYIVMDWRSGSMPVCCNGDGSCIITYTGGASIRLH